jgi:DGQHR domain-containing protein
MTAGPALLPNAIIVSLSTDTFVSDGYINIPERENAEAFVLDGQHRLWAFAEEYSGPIDMTLVVSAFIDLGEEFKALLFRTINGTQRKINPSLVYDLIPMLREREWVTFEDQRAYSLVSELNQNQDSSWYDRVGMVGGAERLISLSSFMTAIKKLLKKGHIFYGNDPDFFEEAIQSELLTLYFNVISRHYSREWNNKHFLVCKYIGVSSMLNVLEDIIVDLRRQGIGISDKQGLRMSASTFDPYIARLKSFRFSAKAAKEEGISYVGEGGIKQLTERIRQLMFPSTSRT